MIHHIDGTELISKRVTKHRFRKSIIDAWHGRCAYCGREPEGKITLDHVIPKCKGGHTVKENLVPACIRCNGSKNHHEWLEWFRGVAWYGLKREGLIRVWIEADEDRTS